MDLLRSGTLAALLLVLPGAAGCQALFSKARIESPEEAAISKAVKTRLAAEKTVNLTSIEVETNSGTVYLSGVVTSLAARERALKLAWEVKGVQTVVNHLEVEKSLIAASLTVLSDRGPPKQMASLFNNVLIVSIYSRMGVSDAQTDDQLRF